MMMMMMMKMIYLLLLISILFSLVSSKYVLKSKVLPIWKKYVQNTKAILQDRELKKIESIVGEDRSVCVITIVGDYHSGKSSLNNALIGNYSYHGDIFKVAADIPPETQGFEVVVLIDDEDDDLPAIILVDTPGTSAIDYDMGQQSSYFGASYLMSSTLVYTTLRRVGSRTDLDFLADRLRFVLSTNATIPDEYQPAFGTPEPNLVWLIQNVDLENAKESEENQINLFINDHKNRRYELSTIFKGGVNPYTLPTPSTPDILKHFTANEDTWTNEYRDKMKNLRDLLLNSKKPLRVWKNIKEWRKRLEISFNEDIAKVLSGLTIDTQREAVNVAQKILIQNAISQAISEFSKKSKLVPLAPLATMRQKLEDLKKETQALATSRAVAVPFVVLEDAFRTSFYGTINALAEQASSTFAQRIDEEWNKQLSLEMWNYISTRDSELSIPFKPSKYDKNLFAQTSIDALESAVGSLKEDVLVKMKYTAVLREKISMARDDYLNKNDKKIETICNSYGSEVASMLKEKVNILTNGLSSTQEPIEGLEDKAETTLIEVLTSYTDPQGFFFTKKLGDLKWITSQSYWKTLVYNFANQKKIELLAQVKSVQNQRVEIKAKANQKICQIDFDAKIKSGIILPQREEVVTAHVNNARDQMMMDLEIRMSGFQNYPAVDAVRKDLMAYARVTLIDMNNENERKWNELFKTPAKEAKREFIDFHKKCEALPYNERIFQLACFKVDSLLFGIPSFRGYARDKLNHKVLSAIQAAWKKEKARMGVKTSKAQIFEVSKDQLKRFIDSEDGLGNYEYINCFSSQLKFSLFITIATLLTLFIAIYSITDVIRNPSFAFIPVGASIFVVSSIALLSFLYI